jgi:hypothetical protein
MGIAQDRRSIVRSVAGGIAATAAVAGLVSVGAGTASAAPQSGTVYTKEFTVRYHPTPQSAVLGAEIALYYFNSQRLNGNQACVEQPKPVVKPDTPVGWTATVTALCARDAGTAQSAAPVAG